MGPRRGQELFYFAPNGALIRVSVAAGPRWTPSAPTKVLEGHYAVGSGLAGGAPDGQRFLMLKAAGSDTIVAPP